MRTLLACTLAVLTVVLLVGASIGYAGTVVFVEKGFPSIDNGTVSRSALERALAPLNPRFVGLDDLRKPGALADGDLLVLPYGSAFPGDAWEAIRRHLDRGNMLVLGGRPFFVPVTRDSTGWHISHPQNSFARTIGIEHSYAAPQHSPWTLRWDADAPFFQTDTLKLNPRRVFVNGGRSMGYRGIGFLVDQRGNRLAAPVTADDPGGWGQPARRRVFLSFDADSASWESPDAAALIRATANYASRGGSRLWIDLDPLTLDPGAHVSGAVDVRQGGATARLTLELLSGSTVLASRTTPCGTTLHEEINLPVPLNEPGVYTVRATLSSGDTMLDRYTSGVSVRDTALLHSGLRLEAGRDYFRLGGKPYLMAGVNYFSTDHYTSAFFVGGSIGGNVSVWERDFSEMEQQGVTTVRTGIWLNRARYLDVVSGAVSERLLRAVEAYLTAAARHRLQVIFTFFAFDPQAEMEPGQGQAENRLGPGTNPYLDPAAIDAQLAYVRSIASRFRDVPFLGFDLINEPSFSNPRRLWKGNSPNSDPAELAAWRLWLEKRYLTIDRLAEAWHTTRNELGAFDRVPLPAFADLEPSRYGNPRIVRAVDYNLFAQESFLRWADTIIDGIRGAGARQAITVGQDEGGVADRLLNHFWSASHVDYTTNHSWWRDDALLWNSVAAKTPLKPNIIGETGPQPVWGMDGVSRWDDIQGFPLLERKLALGFANANAGVLHWDWTRSDDFGLLRRDGSQKQWMEALAGIAAFARNAQPYATAARLPDVALVLPQSLQLSAYGIWALTVQQSAVRALYHHARSAAFAVGEHQLANMPEAKLIILPAPWVVRQDAWEALMNKVRGGATLLVSGRIDADEHWLPVPERAHDWHITYSPASLTTRETVLKWPGGTSHLSYSGERTTYAERGVLAGGETFAEIPLGKGRILYSALPLELTDQLDEVGKIYAYALKRAGVRPAYETSCDDPGILIAPTSLPGATLYVLTSESARTNRVEFTDRLSGEELSVSLAPGRAALLLVTRDGKTVASYSVGQK